MRSLFKIKIPFVWNTTLPLCITGSRRFGTTQCSHLHGPIAQASQNSDLITHWRNVTVTPSLHRCNNLKIREIQRQFLPFPPSPPPPYHGHQGTYTATTNTSVPMAAPYNLSQWLSTEIWRTRVRLPFHQFILPIPVTRKILPPPPRPLQPPRRPVVPRRIDARASRNVIRLPALSVDGAQQMENTSNLKTLY